MKTVRMKIIICMSSVSAGLLLLLGLITSTLTYTGTIQSVESDMKRVIAIASERVQWECSAFLNVAEIAGMNPTLSNKEYAADNRVALLNTIAKANGLVRGVVLDDNGSISKLAWICPTVSMFRRQSTRSPRISAILRKAAIRRRKIKIGQSLAMPRFKVYDLNPGSHNDV